MWADRLAKDIAFGLRRLWRDPGLSVVAVMALALGIGVNTAVFISSIRRKTKGDVPGLSGGGEFRAADWLPTSRKIRITRQAYAKTDFKIVPFRGR